MKRSTEAPMDFEYTNRPQTTPVWATPAKRSHADLAPSTPTPSTPTRFGFGENKNVPFIFQSPPAPHSPTVDMGWAPPPNFSPEKAFPEVRDVDMPEASPGDERRVATGALRRVHRSRMQAKAQAQAMVETDSDSEDGEEGDYKGLQRTGSTSNHYTVNMAAPAPPPSDVPYVLLGYLQFFFNLSLVLLFLYLVLAFIWTVQRDVQERISEYSQDIIQDIALCRRQHTNNLCDTPLPAMAAQCAAWATCMARDPAVVGRARVGAELIAEVVNGFVEPISWKTLGFTLTSLAFLTLFVNTLLSLYRERAKPTTADNRAATPGPVPVPMHLPLPPATPYRHPAQGGYLSPAPTPAWGRKYKQDYDAEEDGLATPTRARRRRIEGGAAVKVR